MVEKVKIFLWLYYKAPTTNPMTSTAQNDFDPFGAGSPNGVSLPVAIKIRMSCSAKLSNFAVVATSRRSGKPLLAQVVNVARVRSSAIIGGGAR